MNSAIWCRLCRKKKRHITSFFLNVVFFLFFKLETDVNRQLRDAIVVSNVQQHR